MTEGPPPIALIVFFEAAARHLSFKDAARELSVTPSAVSQRIAELEDRLRLKLFLRGTRSLRLTEAGEFYADVAAEVINKHQSGYANLKRLFGRATLRVNVTPAMAHDVLIPRIGEFHRAHRDIDLRIEASMESVDLNRELVDATIRFGDGGWDDVTSVHLVDATISPACSPELAETRTEWSIADVFEHPLITALPDARDWKEAGAALGHRGPFPTEIVRASSHLEAAVLAAQGVGFALAFFPVMTQWCIDGRLVTPAGLDLADRGLGYYGVCPADLEDDPRVPGVLHLGERRAERARLSEGQGAGPEHRLRKEGARIQASFTSPRALRYGLRNFFFSCWSSSRLSSRTSPGFSRSVLMPANDWRARRITRWPIASPMR